MIDAWEFISTLTDEKQQALVNYTGDSYMEINNSLRQHVPTADAIKLLDIFNTAPVLQYELEVYRAIDAKYLPADGLQHVFLGFMSTTPDSSLDNAPVDENSAVLEIIVPAGIAAIPWNEMSEEEIILPHGMVAVVTSREPFVVENRKLILPAKTVTIIRMSTIDDIIKTDPV